MSHRLAVLTLLADGAVHSGPEIGGRLGVSRAAVHKVITQLHELGVVIECRRGEGYRLDPRFAPLDVTRIHAAAPSLRGRSIVLLEEVDSTNRHLLRLAEQGVDVHGQVCLAERQTAGAGRRGRTWSASAYRNLMVSLAWRFEAGSARLGGLSLAVGVAVRDALAHCGVAGARLKWPNDLVVGLRKLGGILIDVRAEAGSPALAICGVGINVSMGSAEALRIDQAWTDIEQEGGAVPDRNRVAGAVIQAMFDACQEFALRGFVPFQEQWERFHRDTGQRVQVTDSNGQGRFGEALGVDEHGGLRLRQDNGTVTVYSGDVTLRRESAD